MTIAQYTPPTDPPCVCYTPNKMMICLPPQGTPPTHTQQPTWPTAIDNGNIVNSPPCACYQVAADVLVGAEEHEARLAELLQRRRELLGDQ